MTCIKAADIACIYLAEAEAGNCFTLMTDDDEVQCCVGRFAFEDLHGDSDEAAFMYPAGMQTCSLRMMVAHYDKVQCCAAGQRVIGRLHTSPVDRAALRAYGMPGGRNTSIRLCAAVLSEQSGAVQYYPTGIEY